MIPSGCLPPKKASQQSPTEKDKREFEPPMNTDEHRLKADKTKAIFIKIILFFIMQLSVFIGVHRWLNVFCFNHLNQDHSVDAFVGACDASVSA
jgi:hypothetical protein